VAVSTVISVMMRATAIVLLLAFSTAAFAENVPLPRARPAAEEPKVAQIHELSPIPSDCQIRLADKADIERRPTIVGPGVCGGYDMVRITAVRVGDGSKVAINPPADLRCPMAQAVADFVRETIVPSFAPVRVTTVENFDAYSCRGRNRVFGAKISEHGKGNAIDIRAIRLAGGASVEPTDPKASRDLRERLKQEACARFKTVLGPGSDGFHEGHVHLDLAERRRGMSMCQWDVRDPPPPPTIVAQVPLPTPRPLQP
jgi:hypothetical protein